MRVTHTHIAHKQASVVRIDQLFDDAFPSALTIDRDVSRGPIYAKRQGKLPSATPRSNNTSGSPAVEAVVRLGRSARLGVSLKGFYWLESSSGMMGRG